MSINIEEALEKYKVSQEFEEDCNTLRSSSILKNGYLMDDYEIELLAIAEKEKELNIEKECMEQGHDLNSEDCEVIGGQEWVSCSRCGQWFERGKPR